jgi:hypothetical protein
MIVFPMAGMSTRFSNAGFTEPKYKLPFGDGYCFDLAVKTFYRYFRSDRFVFLPLLERNETEFIRGRCRHLGIRNYDILELPEKTKGQADTVARYSSHASPDEELYIFNIDTHIRDFVKPPLTNEVAGHLDLFHAVDGAWSYAKVLNGHVLETAEKKIISNYASNGLYYFRSFSLFEECFDQKKQDLGTLDEIYVAPMFNILIEKSMRVNFRLVPYENMILFGTPDQYQISLDQYA